MAWAMLCAQDTLLVCGCCAAEALLAHLSGFGKARQGFLPLHRYLSGLTDLEQGLTPWHPQDVELCWLDLLC